MNKLSLLLPLFLIACQGPSDQDCQNNFAVVNFQMADYRECSKDALIQDFEDYIIWIERLERQGELHRERILKYVPQEVIKAKRVFCSRACSATHFLEGQCFLWGSHKRKKIQEIDRLARLEPKGCEAKYQYLKDKYPTHYIDYDWLKSWKHTKDRSLGGRIWKSL